MFRSPLAFLTALLIGSSSFSQSVEPTVALHTDRLSQEEREYVARLADDLKSAIAGHNWTAQKYRYSLPVQIEIFFDKYARVGSHHRYTAGILIALKNGIQLREKRWEFLYNQDERLHIGEPYSTLTGMIEYGINITLGFEADRMKSLAGSNYYELARQVGERARAEALFTAGWDDRRALAFDLTDTLYTSVRRARYNAEAGIFFAGKENWEQATANLEKAVEFLLYSTPSRANTRRGDTSIRFVDLEALAGALKKAGMQEQLRLLAEWDSEGAERYR